MKNWQMQTLLILLLLRGVVFTKNFTITRREGDRWEEGKDVFKIPTACPTVSTSSESSHCEHFNAKRVDNEQDHCACSCPKDNATFLFHNQTRTCMDNSEVRTLLGCKNMAYFFQEVQQNPLRLLKKEDKERKLHLSSTQNCRENITSSWYIGCDGTRHPLKRNNMILKNYGGFYRLEVGDVEDNLKGRIINLAIQCTKKSTVGGPRASTSETCLLFKLEGTIECPFEDQSSPSTSPTPPISTSVRRSPVETRPVVVMSVPAVLPSTRHAVTIKTTPILEALTTESLVERSAIQPDSTVSQPRVSSAGIRPTTAVNSVPVGQTDAGREEQGSDRGSLSLGLIIGLCVSSTLVLFIVGFFIYRRRKSSRKSPKSKVAGPTKDTMKLNSRVYAECQPDGSTRNGSVGYANGAYVPEYDKPTQRTKNNMSYSQPNKFPPRPLHGSTKKPVGVGQLSPGHALQEPTYQLFEGPSSDSTGEHERYTCPKVHPASTTNLYQALNSPDGHIYGPGFSEEPVYNVLEDPFQDGTGDPDGYISCQRDPALYNALHEHIPGTSEGHRENDPDPADEPVYNVLEDRNHDGADDESVHAEDPVYNVLKGPNEDGVEGPCNDGPGTTDVPIYSVLEGPDLSSDYDQPSQPTYATVKRRNHRV